MDDSRNRKLLKQIALKLKIEISGRPIFNSNKLYRAEIICFSHKDEEKLRILERKFLKGITGLKKTQNE